MSSAQQTTSSTYRTGIRRKRQILSCLECKRRKIKCDRQVPTCGKCREVGHADQCKYDERSANSKSAVSGNISPRTSIYKTQTPLPTSLSTSIAGNHAGDLVRGTKQHTNISCATLPARADSPGAASPVLNAENPDWHQPLLHGVRFETQFHGLSHSVGSVAYFGGLREFLSKTITEHPVLGAKEWSEEHTPTLPRPSMSSLEPNDTFSRLLPSEQVCRSFIQSYFKHYEGMYRIIHSGTFWQQYNDYWAIPEKRKNPFEALLLAAMSCSRCLYKDNPLLFDGDSSNARSEAQRWLQAVEQWQDQQSRKHTTLIHLQIKCLLLISKRVNVIKIKRMYTLSQTLLAEAISLGLHRAPKIVTSMPYDREMRRRLWSTISELELTESIERGVPSLVSTLYTDIEAPKNVHEVDFTETMSYEPEDRPDDVYTESTLARYSHSIRMLRHSINNIVNNPEVHRSLSLEKLNLLHGSIIAKFGELVSWPTARDALDYSGNAFWCKACAEVRLHEALIMLHLPLALASITSSTQSHSRFVCSVASKNILGIYKDLGENGFSQICLPRTPIMRASLCLCLVESKPVIHGMFEVCGESN